MVEKLRNVRSAYMAGAQPVGRVVVGDEVVSAGRMSSHGSSTLRLLSTDGSWQALK